MNQSLRSQLKAIDLGIKALTERRRKLYAMGEVAFQKGMVIVSGYPCELYDELFGDWRRLDKRHHADGAQDRTECLWFSPNLEVMSLF